MNRTEAIARRKDSANQSQMHFARKGIITEEMAHVAEAEQVDAELVRDELAAGRLVIPANIHHVSLDPMGIGIALPSSGRMRTSRKATSRI